MDVASSGPSEESILEQTYRLEAYLKGAGHMVDTWARQQLDRAGDATGNIRETGALRASQGL